MHEKPWIKRYAEEIVIGLLICLIWAGVVYLFEKDNTFARPFFYGLVAASLLTMTYLMFRFTRRIPKPKTLATDRNIEGYVRTWLNNLKVTTKNDPNPSECHFRLRLTVDSGCAMTVMRTKDQYEDYIQVICDLSMRGDDKKLLGLFTENEKGQILVDIKTELARAKVGYSGLVDAPEEFHIFRRLPIHPAFNEHTLMYMLGDVEAARNLVLLVFLKARMNQSANVVPPPSQPQLEKGTEHLARQP